MSDPRLAAPLEDVRRASGVQDAWPYTHIIACLAVWQDRDRLLRLLFHLRPYFARVIVGVQESTDGTLEAVRESGLADLVVSDGHHGFGDATFGPRLLPLVTSKWTFKVDADEWPTEELLGTLTSATFYAEHPEAFDPVHQAELDALWIPFRSSVEGIPYEERHAHLRLFQTHLGWPAMLHSTPPSRRNALWEVEGGFVNHDRSLDEMIQDYLRYHEIGLGNQGWTEHNRLMMRAATMGVADVKGWDFVQSFDWWPQVEATAYEGVDKPWPQTSPSDTRTTPPTPSPRSPRSTSRRPI